MSSSFSRYGPYSFSNSITEVKDDGALRSEILKKLNNWSYICGVGSLDIFFAVCLFLMMIGIWINILVKCCNGIWYLYRGGKPTNEDITLEDAATRTV